jgi:hypothetical protein
MEVKILTGMSTCSGITNLHYPLVFGIQRKWVMSIAGLLLALILAFTLTRDQGPSYKGKSLRDWLDQYEIRLGQFDSEAADAIRHMGTNAVPDLLKYVAHEPQAPGIKWKAGQLLRRVIPTIPAPTDYESQRADIAAISFSLLTNHS